MPSIATASTFIAHPEQELAEVEWLHYGRYLHERIGGKPTQYITRRQEFYGREFRVTPDVLIPGRRPSTSSKPRWRSGAERNHSRRRHRLRRDCRHVGFGNGRQLHGRPTFRPPPPRWHATTRFVLGLALRWSSATLMEAIASASIGLIVSNPPYVPLGQREGLQREIRDWEPAVALYGGETGFDIYRRIVADAPRVLGPGGWLVMELGFGCRERVAEMLAGWRDVRIEPDLAGIPRVIAARMV